MLLNAIRLHLSIGIFVVAGRRGLAGQRNWGYIGNNTVAAFTARKSGIILVRNSSLLLKRFQHRRKKARLPGPFYVAYSA